MILTEESAELYRPIVNGRRAFHRLLSVHVLLALKPSVNELRELLQLIQQHGQHLLERKRPAEQRGVAEQQQEPLTI